MKSGVGWQVRGVGREARETAREAARRSGMSVGEWLDTVIIDTALDEGIAPPHSGPHHGTNGQSMRGTPARDAGPRHPDDDFRPLPKRRKHAESDDRHRPGHHEGPRPPSDRGLSAINNRLDELTRQLDKLARLNAGHAQSLRASPRDDEGARQFASAISNLHERLDQLTEAEGQPRSESGSYAGAVERPRPSPPPSAPATPLDQAMLEIAERQRALDGYPAAPTTAKPAAPGGPLPRARTQELQGLEQQLRQINAQIETLSRPCSVDTAVHKVVDTLRDDLAEIGVMLQEAMPRKAVEALEGEMRRLTERIDHTRQAGTDGSALSGIERGLSEVRDALRALTPAENLAGLDDAVKGLAQKIDSLSLGQQDPAALKQLEGAIVAMRGIVSHVASNDALAKLADEVRTLSVKVEQATGDTDALSTLERRIGTLADALEARDPGAQSVPREFEAVVKGLSDKLERLQLNRGDDAALGHLEDRIAKLVEKLDASDARLNHLEAIERGLTELLIHIEHNRVPQLSGGDAKQPPARVDALQRDLANLQQTERKTQDSLEAVQGTLGDVVDRIAMIETDIRGKVENTVMATAKAVIASATPPALAAKKAAAEPKPVAPNAVVATSSEALPPAPTLSVPEPIEFPADAPQAKSTPHLAGERRVIDPNLPPDHPLEPGSGASRVRHGTSPADRIAASEAALGSTKPPVIADPGGKSNFIAAARRAAQAAATAEVSPRGNPQPESAGQAVSILGKLAGIMRKRARLVIVGISVIVIVLGSLNIVRHWLGSGDEPERAAPSKAMTSPPPTAPAPAASAPPSAPAAATEAPSAPTTPPPGRQSSLFPTAPVAPFGTSTPPDGAARQAPTPITAVPEVTGTVPAPSSSPPIPPPAPTHAATAPSATPAPHTAPASGVDKLPHAIGGVLRAAAAKGDPAAQFEIAQRFAEGRGVPQNLTEAAEWFERAAKQGLIPAQFRLGGLYEKGFGVKKNAETARRHYTAAGEAGHAKAMHNLAVLYAEGIDGKADYPTAAQWFRKAAVYGVSDSQYNLGILYARGIGVEQNLAEAYRWFALAARNGDQEAAKKRDDVAARLDAPSLRMAKQAVDTFKVEAQPEAATQVKSPPGGWDASPHAVSLVPPAGKRKSPAVGPRLDLTMPRPAQ